MSKGGPQAPNPVDPVVASNAQTASNIATANANRTNSIGPGGSSIWSTDPTGRATLTQSFNPTEQTIFDMMQNTGLQLSPLGGILAGQANRTTAAPLDPSGANQDIISGGPQLLAKNATDAAYGVAKGFLDPQWAQTETDLHDQLSRQGIPVGSDAYNRAMTNFNNSKTQAYGAAEGNAVNQGMTGANNMFGLALQGQQQQLGQQQTLQQNPLKLLSQLYGTGATA